ncbi:MAG: glycosyltransferase family 39 protein [bacterium]|nr:glycosyltransferase family 39 protein [bacterium]
MPGTIRLAFVLPMAAIIACGGPPDAVNLIFVAYHLLLVVLVYLLGRTLHQRTTGVVAAALVAICPPCVIYASMPLPDIPMACFVVGAMGLVAAGTKALATERSKRAMVLAFAGGIVLMLGCTAKISAAVVAPVLVGYLAASGGRRRLRPAVGLALCFVGGFLLVFAIDQGILHLTYENVGTGRFDQLVRTKEIFNNDHLKRARNFYPVDRSFTVARNLRWILGRWYTVLLAGSVLAYPFLKRRSWFLFAVLVWGALYRIYGSASAARYAPHTLQSRYFLIYVVLACVMSGYLVALIWQTVRKLRRHKRWAVAAALACLAVGGAWTLVESIRRVDVSTGTRYRYPTLQGVRRALELAKTAFPCWSVVVQPRLHVTAWSLYREGPASSWFVTSQEKVFADRLSRPFEFLYLCCMDKYAAESDEMLQCGLGVKNVIYSRQGYVIQQERIGRFSAAKSRLEAIRYELLGGLLPPPEPFDGRGVYLWKVVIRPAESAEEDDTRSGPPGVRNADFEQWEKGKPVGWSVPGGTSHLSPSGGTWNDLSPEENSSGGGTAIGLDPTRSGRFVTSVFQDVVLDRSLAGQHLVVSSDSWSTWETSTRLTVEIRRPGGGSARCMESVFHPGDGRWRKLQASVGVPLERTQFLARIRLWKQQPRGTTLFDNVEISVEPIAEPVELDAGDLP